MLGVAFFATLEQIPIKFIIILIIIVTITIIFIYYNNYYYQASLVEGMGAEGSLGEEIIHPSHNILVDNRMVK